MGSLPELPKLAHSERTDTERTVPEGDPMAREVTALKVRRGYSKIFRGFQRF